MTKIKFLHFADPHVGHAGNASRYNEYKALRINKTNEQGINVRQADINDAFSQVFDIAIEKKVDFVLNAGDGTDFWGYKQPNIFNFYAEQVSRLYKHNIPYVEIVGNHNLPKKSGVGCYLETLNLLPEVHVAYKGIYEAIELPQFNTVIHCAPSSFSQELLDDSISQIEPTEGKINIGAGHFGVTAIKHYAENAINSLVVSLDSLINCKMDYFALGDYHTPTDFGYNIRYSGSTERMGFGEIGNTPQVLIVEIDEETKEVSVEPVLLKVRDMIEIPSLDATNKSIEEINEQILSKIEKTNLKDKIVRFRVKNLPVHLKRLIEDVKIREATEDALYFKLEFVDKVNKTKEIRSDDIKYEGVLDGWNSYVDLLEADSSFDKEKLKTIGYKKLSDIYEELNN